MNKNKDMLEVAKLGRTVGLRGSLQLHNLSDFAEQFKTGAVFLCTNGENLCIRSYEPNKGLITFEGYEDINLAKNLTNLSLFCSIDDTRKNCKLKQNEYFYFDIIACKVYEDSMLLGEINNILEVGSGFLFHINTCENLRIKFSKEFFIPYNDNFIIDVDIKNKKIIVKNSFAILENS